jgi:hypothetical protein
VTSAQLTCSWWLSTSGAGRSDENHLTKDFTVFQTNRLPQQLPTTVLYWLANSRRIVYREVLSVIRIVYTSTPVITISTSVSVQQEQPPQENTQIMNIHMNIDSLLFKRNSYDIYSIRKACQKQQKKEFTLMN